MGQCCAKCYVSEEEMELSKNIESSYTVKKDNLCKFGFCSGTDNFVRRDVENNGKQYPSMDLLFDDIDKALSASALSPLIWMLLLVIGAIATPLLVVYDQSTYIWMPWVLPNICLIQPMVWYYYGKRCKTLGKAVKKWNSDFGSSSGVIAYLGIEGCASWRLFVHAMGFRSRGHKCQPMNPKVHFIRKSEENKITF